MAPVALSYDTRYATYGFIAVLVVLVFTLVFSGANRILTSLGFDTNSNLKGEIAELQSAIDYLRLEKDQLMIHIAQQKSIAEASKKTIQSLQQAKETAESTLAQINLKRDLDIKAIMDEVEVPEIIVPLAKSIEIKTVDKTPEVKVVPPKLNIVVPEKAQSDTSQKAPSQKQRKAISTKQIAALWDTYQSFSS